MDVVAGGVQEAAPAGAITCQPLARQPCEVPGFFSKQPTHVAKRNRLEVQCDRGDDEDTNQPPGQKPPKKEKKEKKQKKDKSDPSAAGEPVDAISVRVLDEGEARLPEASGDDLLGSALQEQKPKKKNKKTNDRDTE
mmetsp:Transcript_60476/g.141656  ORF Transcript_60476/g.141656 Transcript_60476/m.141656 type:complete len:137 (-) Transcript_60476:74-484(-)